MNGKNKQRVCPSCLIEYLEIFRYQMSKGQISYSNMMIFCEKILSFLTNFWA